MKLQEQPFQILAMLLENPGETVTLEELRARLWPVDIFVDYDHSLNSAIQRLRDALGDSAENPRFVESVARRGYRFVAPILHSRMLSGRHHEPIESIAVLPFVKCGVDADSEYLTTGSQKASSTASRKS